MQECEAGLLIEVSMMGDVAGVRNEPFVQVSQGVGSGDFDLLDYVGSFPVRVQF